MAYFISVSREPREIFWMANRYAWEFIPLAAAQAPDDEELAEKLEMSTYIYGIALEDRVVDDRDFAIKAARVFRKAAVLLADGAELPPNVFEFVHLKEEGIGEHFATLVPLLDNFLTTAGQTDARR